MPISADYLNRLPSSEEVKDAFSTFKVPMHIHDLGGCPIDKTPLTKPGYYDSKDYHVESTFNTEQRPYVVSTLTLLNAMAMGKLDESPSFGTRLLNSVTALKLPTHFDEELVKVNLEQLADFHERFPNLDPAVAAIYQIAGASGTSVAIDESYARHISLTSPDDKPIPRHKFFGHHRSIPGFELRYEVWCAGEAFAQTMIRETRAAVYLFKKSALGRLRFQQMVQKKAKYPRQQSFTSIRDGVKTLTGITYPWAISLLQESE